MKSLTNMSVFKELFKTDFMLFKRIVKDKIINLFIWIVTMIGVNAYIMPAFGLTAGYGGFMLASILACSGLFEVTPSVCQIISDIEGDRIIDYKLTLPIPSWLVFVESLVNYAFSAAAMAILILPVGKLILWHIFSFDSVNILQFIVMFILLNLFYGALTLWQASFVKDMASIENAWMRCIYPMWFLGCFQFSWDSLYHVSPTLAYLDLVNPMTYIAEGTRIAVLGTESSLNFWVCAAMTLLFCIVGTVHGIKRLQKRLDFV